GAFTSGADDQIGFAAASSLASLTGILPSASPPCQTDFFVSSHLPSADTKTAPFRELLHLGRMIRLASPLRRRSLRSPAYFRLPLLLVKLTFSSVLICLSPIQKQLPFGSFCIWGG
ncbi:MAG: hypothetical protein IJ099_02860, partial [Alphaproteobacteria bacterium]|nr:hypothetical protein [Alphaproteobacteria bacterium]